MASGQNKQDNDYNARSEKENGKSEEGGQKLKARKDKEKGKPRESEIRKWWHPHHNASALCHSALPLMGHPSFEVVKPSRKQCCYLVC